MFMPDQLRYDSLGCTGNPVIKTPHFDQLAREGTLFKSEPPALGLSLQNCSADPQFRADCFTQASVCTQSRCSMFTGQYLHTSAHRSLDFLLKPWEDNMFKVLKDAEYHVCTIAPRGDLFSPGVTEMSVTEVSKDFALAWVSSVPRVDTISTGGSNPRPTGLQSTGSEAESVVAHHRPPTRLSISVSSSAASSPRPSRRTMTKRRSSPLSRGSSRLLPNRSACSCRCSTRTRLSRSRTRTSPCTASWSCRQE
jgi:hypothetical protein